MLALRSACWLTAAACIGCATAPLERDAHYPADWPAIVTAREDCKALEGAYENKGELVDERGRRTEVWLTDLFGKYFAKKEVTDAREGLRQFDRASLILKPGRLRRSSARELVLSFELSRQSAGQPDVGIEALATLKPRPVADGEGGWCASGNLLGYSTEMFGGTWSSSNCILALGSDESLIVKCRMVFGGIFIAVPFYITRDYWAHFPKSP